MLQEAVNKGYDEADTYIAKFQAGRLQLQQGCDMEQSLESLVTRTLNEVREAAAKVSGRRLRGSRVEGAGAVQCLHAGGA